MLLPPTTVSEFSDTQSLRELWIVWVGPQTQNLWFTLPGLRTTLLTCWRYSLSNLYTIPWPPPPKPLESAFPDHASHWNQNDLPKTDMTRVDLLLYTTSLAPQSLPGRVLKIAHRAIPNLASDHPFSIFCHSRPAPHTEHLLSEHLPTQLTVLVIFPTHQAWPHHSAQALPVSPYLEGPPNTPYPLHLLSQASNPSPRPALLSLSQPPASSEDAFLAPSAELRTLWSTFLCVSWAVIKVWPGWFTKKTSVAYFSSGPWVPGKQCHARCCTPRAGLGSKISCQIPLLLQGLRIHLPMQETQEAQVLSLGQEDPLAKEMATHSSILAWKIPWTGEPDGLPSIGSQRVKTRLSNWACMHTHFPWDDQRIGQASTFILTRLQWLMCVYVAQSCLTLYNPSTVTSRLLSPWNFPGKITGVGCHFLLQRIFPIKDLTQVSRMAGRFFTVWATSLQWLELGNDRKSSGTFQSATVPTHPYCLHSAHLSQWCFLLGPAGIWVYNHRFRQICSV